MNQRTYYLTFERHPIAAVPCATHGLHVVREKAIPVPPNAHVRVANGTE